MGLQWPRNVAAISSSSSDVLVVVLPVGMGDVEEAAESFIEEVVSDPEMVGDPMWGVHDLQHSATWHKALLP